MESYYEINVSLNGVHFFATAPRSLRMYDRKKLKSMAELFEEKFPKSEGYEITITYWEGNGKVVDLSEL